MLYLQKNNSKNDTKVIGRCHIAAESRGSARKRFSLNFTYFIETPVVIHKS